jgi:phosphatidylinositol dimannoside acyltransferase
MDFQQLVTTEFGTRAWLALGAVPPRLGYAFGRWLTRRLYHRKTGVVYRVLFENQKRVLGAGASWEQVDAAVAAVLRHAGMTNYDMVRILRGGEPAMINAIEMDSEFWPVFRQARATGRGILICGAHLSNFNLGFLAFAGQSDDPIQVLSASNTAGGFGVLSDLRSRGSLEDTRISPASLKQAVARLRGGGIALIGIDWPVPDTDDGVEFFGEPSLLPSGSIRLALSADPLLMPIACRWTPQRGYRMITCPPLELERTGNRETDIRVNSRRILSIVEGWIAEAPEQWLMYHPVWPDAVA